MQNRSALVVRTRADIDHQPLNPPKGFKLMAKETVRKGSTNGKPGASRKHRGGDLAVLLSRVLRHPDCPLEIETAIADALLELRDGAEDMTAPEVIREILTKAKG
jgi:hypothetical protein